MFECDKCGKEFKSERGLCGHQAHCGKDKKECPICNRQIGKSNYKIHLKAHKYDTDCPHCGELVIGKEKKFCNSSCSASYNGKGLVRNGKPASNCRRCGIKLKTSKGKFCSRKCQQVFKHKEFVEKWLADEINGATPNGLDVSSYVRNYVKKISKGKCSICDLDEWMGNKMPLILDHIDGNYLNNKSDNLRMVCGNCDMQLPTFAGKNKGNGRHWRRERYKAGKSH